MPINREVLARMSLTHDRVDIERPRTGQFDLQCIAETLAANDPYLGKGAAIGYSLAHRATLVGQPFIDSRSRLRNSPLPSWNASSGTTWSEYQRNLDDLDRQSDKLLLAAQFALLRAVPNAYLEGHSATPEQITRFEPDLCVTLFQHYGLPDTEPADIRALIDDRLSEVIEIERAALFGSGMIDQKHLAGLFPKADRRNKQSRVADGAAAVERYLAVCRDAELLDISREVDGSTRIEYKPEDFGLERGTPRSKITPM